MLPELELGASGVSSDQMALSNFLTASASTAQHQEQVLISGSPTWVAESISRKSLSLLLFNLLFH